MPAVPQARRVQRCGPTARKALRRAQVLGGVFLHAHEQVEARVADAADEGFVDQRLQHVDRPLRLIVGRQDEDGLGRFEREAAVEYRELRQRRLLDG